MSETKKETTLNDFESTAEGSPRTKHEILTAKTKYISEHGLDEYTRLVTRSVAQQRRAK